MIFDPLFDTIASDAAAAKLAVNTQFSQDQSTIADLQSQISSQAQTISQLQAQIAADQAEEAAEQNAPVPQVRILTTKNTWIDETPNDGSKQPSSKPVPTIDADGTQIAVSIPNGSALFVKKFGDQPSVTNVSYCMQRQYAGAGKLMLWESDLIVTRSQKKWNGSFQLRFDLGTIQIWGPTSDHPGGTWVDTGLKHGITDPTVQHSIQVNFQLRPNGIFYDSVIIDSVAQQIAQLMPLEDTNWGNQFILQLQSLLSGGGGVDTASG